MRDLVVVIPQFTPSHIFCYTLQCPNKGCKQHSQLSDSGAGAFQHAAFCMVRISQIFSSYPAVIILPLQGKRIQSHRSFTTLYMPFGLSCKTWQNWPTRLLLLALLLQQPNGLWWFTCQWKWGQVYLSAAGNDGVGPHAAWKSHLTLKDFHVWLNTQTITFFNLYWFFIWHLGARGPHIAEVKNAPFVF